MKIKTSELIGPALDWAVAKCCAPIEVDSDNYWEETYLPSEDWAQGGPIIEQEGIALFWDGGNEQWDASLRKGWYVESGSTPLIAAMRCYVASKLGDEMNVPDELIKEK